MQTRHQTSNMKCLASSGILFQSAKMRHQEHSLGLTKLGKGVNVNCVTAVPYIYIYAYIYIYIYKIKITNQGEQIHTIDNSQQGSVLVRVFCQCDIS